MKERYLQQLQDINMATETIARLDLELKEITLKLKENPINSENLRELKRISLDRIITMNELEHYTSQLANITDRL